MTDSRLQTGYVMLWQLGQPKKRNVKIKHIFEQERISKEI